MKNYKVEVLTFFSKMTLDKNHIAKSSQEEVQAKLDEYAQKGYQLVSTNATGYGTAVYIYLYFEKSY